MSSEPAIDAGRILVVDDSAVVRAIVCDFLKAAGHEIDTAEDGRVALDRLEAADYDVIITDLKMPALDGFGLLEAVRRRPSPPEVIILTGTHGADVNCAVLALRLGAHDFLAKPPSGPAEVIMTVARALEKKRLRDANARLVRELEALSRTDALTGALNRRAFDQALGQETARAARYDLPVAVLLADMDHFKRVNDGLGHTVGDAVLREFVRRVSGALRETDSVYRYGGEEFAILLPHTDLEAAMVVAERLVAVTSAQPVRYGAQPAKMTVSIGVACARGAGLRAESLVQAADEALYEAKSRGRNQAVAHGSMTRAPQRVTAFRRVASR